MTNKKTFIAEPTLDDIITAAIVDRLTEHGWNQSKAALSLQISRGTLRSYMKKAMTRLYPIPEGVEI